MSVCATCTSFGVALLLLATNNSVGEFAFSLKSYLPSIGPQTLFPTEIKTKINVIDEGIATNYKYNIYTCTTPVAPKETILKSPLVFDEITNRSPQVICHEETITYQYEDESNGNGPSIAPPV
ncbi:hypothetical protein FVEN_g13196 [Fusarium venenatum]|nr:hypothetical protein FVEN_g13196 [Fusarium venenatum]